MDARTRTYERSKGCPPPSMLVNFHSGLLSDENDFQVLYHLESCPSCSSAIEQLNSDQPDLLDVKLKECFGLDPPTLDESGFRNLDSTKGAQVDENWGDTASLRGGPGASIEIEIPQQRRIGPYQILGEVEDVHYGGMGMVYRGRHLALKRIDAIKVPKISTRPSLESRIRFANEIEAHARLDHPNIARIYGSGQHDGQLYFAMEWVNGGTLAQLIQNAPKHQLKIRQAVEIIHELGLAVAFAHHLGVIHRDIKPRNVLLTEGRAVKLSDFGLAIVLDSGEDRPTETGRVIGTASYMSPEQARGARDVDHRTDIFALGAILYETFTGRPPFLGPNSADTLKLVRECEVRRPSNLRKDLPPELEEICLHCLQKEPRNRYQSAAEFAEQLARWSRGDSTFPSPPSSWRRIRHWIVRLTRKRWKAMSMILGVVLLMFLVRALAPVPATATTALETQQEYLERVRRDLRAGQTVELYGDTGIPRYYKWQLGAAVFGASPTGDTSCYYETLTHGLLELFDNPGVDRYRIHLEIRQVQRIAQLGNGAQSVDQFCGLYFGHTYTERTGGVGADAMFAVTFLDVRSAQPHKVLFQTILCGRDPGGFSAWTRSRFAECEYDPSPMLPGPWRSIDVVVAPDQIRAFWEKGGEFEEIGGSRKFVPAKKYAEIPELIPRVIKGNNPGILIPAWKSKAAFGVFTNQCAVCIKNIRVEPLQ